MHTLSLATPEELKVEIALGKNEAGEPTYYHTDAATVMLAYSECTRGIPAPSLQESHELFRKQISQAWGHEITLAMAYLIVEMCVKITSDLKKKHISVTS